jgi:squalene cyclase
VDPEPRFLGVTAIYVILYALTLLAAASLIDSNYLQSTLHHVVGITDYAELVWLTSSVGIVAGALGASLESEEAIRKATYSKREQERRARNLDRADDADGYRAR